jgi:hypothetical protein
MNTDRAKIGSVFIRVYLWPEVVLRRSPPAIGSSTEHSSIYDALQ